MQDSVGASTLVNPGHGCIEVRGDVVQTFQATFRVVVLFAVEVAQALSWRQERTGRLCARPTHNNPTLSNMNSDLQSAVRYIDEHELKLVTAESCTAGLVASTLSEIPGCGKWLECAFVTYSEDSKLRHLHVRPETLERYNLTSEEVAREMAEGALHLCQANVAVSDTGLAGPSGGDGGVPVGTVCFAWAFEQDGKTATYAETRHFDGDRNEVRRAASDFAITRLPHFHRRFQMEWKPGLALTGNDRAQPQSQSNP